ncbi:hypothetical protein IWW37_000412 [Coemansia sp. RSA 2050]|nr:hypothetical protein IWW37_000412 [Coemansia sp. RSA 2050]KAJ2734187.1 hypothetical protein IW152_002526 [Coemansia sp. BCRC 34962]
MSLSVNDPLLQVVEIVGHSGPMASGAAESLHRLYESSADIRACLRLVDPAYMDMLTAAHLASSAVSSADIAQDIVGAGTRMTRLLSAEARNGSDWAATMLADTIDNSAVNCPPMLEPPEVARALLARVKSGQPLRAHARLLRALGSGCDQSLLCAVVDAIVDAPPISCLTQLLCVAAQLIEQDKMGAMSVLAGLVSLRGFTRHVIKLLSMPSPAVAAPALHLLTLILLHPPAQTSPLTILADGLCGKLFDATHIGRTLVLASDLCLNCHQASKVLDDLVVLDAVAGMVAAISHCGLSGDSAQMAVRAAFFASTELVPAIIHLVAMSKLDRRYTHLVLRMVTAIIARPEDASTPLVRALAAESPEGPMSSVVGDMLELVLSGIEDIDDAMPRFGSGLLQTSVEPQLPRVSSDESGCCWLANCSATNRRDAVRFLCAVLNSPPLLADEAERWAPLLIEAISIALTPLFTRAYPSLDAMTLIGKYYWVDRPILGMALDLAAGSRGFRTQWLRYLATANWATTVCQETAAGCMLSEMHKEIASAFALPGSASASFLGDVLCHQPGHSQKTLQSAAIHADLVANVATPSNSSHASSSGAASPYQIDDVIAITDMRMAAAAVVDGGQLYQEGLCISTSTLQEEEESDSYDVISSKISTAVLTQWLRTCEAEAALDLAKSMDTSRPSAILHQLTSAICQARQLPKLSAITSLVAGVSTAASLHRQHTKYVSALKSAVTASVQQSHDHLLASTDAELVYLNGELNRAQAHAEKLTADLGLTRKLADRQSADLSGLREQHSELQAKYRKIEVEAGHWKQECARAKEHLELSEQVARDAHQNLIKQHVEEKQRAVEKAVEDGRAEWDRRHAEMSDTVSGLEQALAEAVPRLRELEAQVENERLAAVELRVQNAAMAAKLADLAHAATALHGLAHRPHLNP